MRDFAKFITFVSLLGLISSPYASDEERKKNVIVQNENDPLGKIVEQVDGVGDAIKDCEAQVEADSNIDKDTCVWDAVVASGKDDEVLELLNSSKKNLGADDTNFDYNMGSFKKERTEAVKVLEDYLTNRIGEIIYGKDAQGIKAAADHTEFYNLYNSQLSKSLVNQLGAYCIYSDPKSGRVPKSNMGLANFYKEENKKKLTSLKSVEDGETGNTKDVSESFAGFNTCLSKISYDCFDNFPSDMENNNLDRSKYNDLDSEEKKRLKKIPTSIISPCELNRYMTGVKVALKKTEDIVGELKNIGNDGFQMNGSGGLAEQKSINSLTNKIINANSKEVFIDSGYKEKIEEEAKSLQKCIDSGQTDGACKEYLTNTEDNKLVSDEAYIRSLAFEKKLEKSFEDESLEVEDFKKYFIHKGMDEKSFDRLVEKLNGQIASGEREGTIAQVLKEEITSRYKKERVALQDSLNERLKETEISVDDEPTAITDKITTIQKKMESSAEDFAASIHYTNIVSSFLEVSGPEGKSSNTVALARELDGNFMEEEGRGVASQGQDYGALQGVVEEDENTALEASTTLSVENIDAIQFGISNGLEDDQ